MALIPDRPSPTPARHRGSTRAAVVPVPEASSTGHDAPSSGPDAPSSGRDASSTGRDATVTSSGTAATMRISDAAERLGVSARTLRFYEELQLVTPSGHTAGGARRYSNEDLARIERVQELKDILGLGLDEIKEVLDTEARIEELRRAYRENAGVSTAGARAERRAILVEALERRATITEQLDRKMARMAAFRAKLAADSARARDLLAELDR